MVKYAKAEPALYKELMACINDDMSAIADGEAFWAFEGKAATRSTSGKCLNYLNSKLPNLFGGSADLAPSNNTELKGEGWFAADNLTGKNIHFGVRKFTMAAATNGISLHGGLRPFCATFFMFSDYLRGALRLSGLMNVLTL